MVGELLVALTGRCLCEAITYQIEGDLAMTGICHCKNCQRQAGTAFSTLAGVPKSQLEIQGELKLYQDGDTASGNVVERWFCGNCGSPIYSVVSAQPDTVLLKTGTLDDTGDWKPQFQIWADTKQNWVTLEEGIPTSEKG